MLPLSNVPLRCAAHGRTFVRSRYRLRRGLTLTELLISVTVTLVLMAALVSAFRAISDEISQSRAILDLAGQLRTSGDTIREDLRGVTVPLKPWVDPAEGLGYFEVAEFTISQDAPAFPVDPTAPQPNERFDNTIADYDDVLMFTARSQGKPFRGRVLVGGAYQTIESPVAEIIYWTTIVDSDSDGIVERWLGDSITLHRRVLLVRPDLNDATTGIVAPANDLITWYRNNDVSVRPSPNGLIANSLGDLSKRENRFAHYIGFDPPNAAAALPAAYPFSIDRNWLNALVTTGNFQGEDILLGDLVSFDVKLYDPEAPVYDDSIFNGGTPRVALVPGDPIYAPTPPLDPTLGVVYQDVVADQTLNTFVSLGAYVDLGYLFPLANNFGSANPNFAPLTNASYFSGQPLLRSGFQALATPRFSPFTFDTWPVHYESDGLDQDGDGLIDEGTNGFDDPNEEVGMPYAGTAVFGPDDAAERETAPPYARTLKGVEVTLRVVEPASNLVRQSSVVVDFVGGQ